ncbi:helix-turn-helix domain-containing protein [Nonomuraea sp. NPDC048826]|uniref:helix-turn-helix domain-containing protein n=1 Tax=Nonomuraea sp. NPDC048826 TaxID=3364347 RepID=UPI00371B1B04
MLITTDDVPRGERHDYWQQVMRERFAVEYRFPFGRHDWFAACCATAQVGTMTAAAMEYAGGAAPSAGACHRTSRMVRRASQDAYQVKLFLGGEKCVVEQDGRQADLLPGDFALVDLTRPMSTSGAGRSANRMLSVVLPRPLLPLPPGRVAEVTGRRLPGHEGPGALLSAVLGRMAGELDAYRPAAATRISTAVLDLMTAVLAARLELTPPPERGRGALLRQVYAYIERRLDDPGLSPPAIAAAHHVSVRHLHKVFQAEERSVARWIRHRRLDRCRRDLADPALADRPVAAIAARWGFPDPAAFSRAFRRVHGLPPGEYRALSLACGSAEF